MTGRQIPRFEPIETERLRIRPVQPGDVDALQQRRSDPTTAEFQAWDVPYPLDRAQALIDDVVALDATPPGDGWFQVTLVERSTDAIVGDLAVHATFDARCAELGWTLDVDARGKGYATEAVTALAAWCVELLGVSRVSATMHPDNHSSARVAERVGMVFEGIAENAFWLDRHDGTAENSHDLRYAMTADQWRAWRERPQSPAGEVHLVPIEPGNITQLETLRTHRSQERLVAPMAASMFDAVSHLVSDSAAVPWLRGVRADGEMVGFVMLAEPTAERLDAYLWRLLIDRMHQRRGVGRQVLDAVVAQAKAWDAPALTVSWMPGPGSPEPFYLGYGFHPTGTNDHGEIDARLDL